ncbi:MAG: carbohydrate kinase [Spirochaetaceae bacterium]|jgi:sugar (pentulose or hexulose) kinase|nr:carbohydrate kinase [Spirochaetaceae bacterium]
MEYAVAVFDVGMTNKKVTVFDDTLKRLDMTHKNFTPRKASAGGREFEVHDLAGIKDFFLGELQKFAAMYPIKAVAVTTHGATFVCLDEAGEVCAPCVLYTHEPGEAFHRAFYTKVGGRDTLQRTTFTPPFSAMINAAKGIFFLQTYLPDEFARTKTILNYPSYWGYVLSGVCGAEPTSIGCHTYLWDHAKGVYSGVTDKLGIRGLLPENYRNSYETLGVIRPRIARETGLSPDTIVTMGIHDSNASLLPYLVKEKAGDFVLNSTGTWCVLMKPGETLDYEPGDIGNVVFFNQSALRKPVKTAIFLGGMELDSYITRYQEINGTATFPPYDPAAFNAVHRENDTFLLPEIVAGSGQFAKTRAGILEKGTFYPFAEITPGHHPEIIRQPERFWALVDTSLVIQTLAALDRAGRKNGDRVFTEGGFRRNRGYNALLSFALPDNEALLTNLNEATSFGAAMTAIMAINAMATPVGTRDALDALDPGLVNIEYLPCDAEEFPFFERYRQQWLTHASRIASS